MVENTLLSTVTIRKTQTSPSVNLAADGSTYWEAEIDITAHAGVECDYTIQCSTDRSTWIDVSNNTFMGGDGVGKGGQDLSHSTEFYTLAGNGPWWRMNVTRVVGTFVVNYLIVRNTSIL